MSGKPDFGIVRIFDSQKMIVGLGFLVGPRRITTCTHVVIQALDIPSEREIQQFIGNTIIIDFPLVAPNQLIDARFVFSAHQSTLNDLVTDIAGLEIPITVPTPGEVLSFSKSGDLWAHDFRAYGFPSQKDEGIWTSGVIRSLLANGTLQIEANLLDSYHIAKGFSGGPVWDNTLNLAIGMIVATERDVNKTTAYVIPTAKIESGLKNIWPDLGFQDLSEGKRVELEKELALHKSILRKLKEQSSIYGIAIPIHLLTQIEQEEMTLNRIAENLNEIKK